MAVAPTTASASGDMKTVLRLLSSLDDLLDREAVAARSGSGTDVRRIQERITPVLSRLTAILADPSVARQVSDRLGRMGDRRRENRALMSVARDRLQRERSRTDEALGRLRSAVAFQRAGRARPLGSSGHLNATT